MADWTEFYAKQVPPSNLADTKRVLTQFASNQREAGRNVVVISSGGTMVPLENNMVRFIDNFSHGTRGAASAEYFLEEGYSVIFLHRQKSLKPYSRQFENVSYLDIMEVNEGCDGLGTIEVDQLKAPALKEVLKKYKEVQESRTLLLVEFITLSDYLFLLKATAEAVAPIGPYAIFYLAAAVSDFYVAKENMPEHKIQSDRPLQINLELVPKMLTPLVKEWSPRAFVITFKLETDVNIISKKARQALEKYNHQVVVSNILQSRKKTVVIVTPTQENAIWMSDGELDTGKEIEEKIVAHLTAKHRDFILAVSQGVDPQRFHLYQSQAATEIAPTPPAQQVQQFRFMPDPGASSANCSPSTNGASSQLIQSAFNNSFSVTQPTPFVPSSPGADGVLHIRLKHEEANATPCNNLLNSPGEASNSPRKFGLLQEAALSEEMKTFIESFKTRRMMLGYTQEDVGSELSRVNGPSYSQSFISRFESKQLGLKAAEKMKPILQSWIEQKELECNRGLRVCKKRKRRTSFSPEMLAMLSKHFDENPKPTSVEIQQIAAKLKLEPVTVKVWFCNRKQMMKRLASGRAKVDNSLRAEIEARNQVKTSIEEAVATALGQYNYNEVKNKSVGCEQGNTAETQQAASVSLTSAVASQGLNTAPQNNLPTALPTQVQDIQDTLYHMATIAASQQSVLPPNSATAGNVLQVGGGTVLATNAVTSGTVLVACSPNPVGGGTTSQAVTISGNTHLPPVSVIGQVPSAGMIDATSTQQAGFLLTSPSNGQQAIPSSGHVYTHQV